MVLLFQPTRPLRDATRPSCTWVLKTMVFQPTRPLRDATARGRRNGDYRHISTHASLAGRDEKWLVQSADGQRFQPTRPLRDATRCGCPRDFRRPYFNPRVPCGTRPFWSSRATMTLSTFQPTRPLRDATSIASRGETKWEDFNPRVPCGTRRRYANWSPSRKHFNPRVPCGTRPPRFV